MSRANCTHSARPLSVPIRESVCKPALKKKIRNDNNKQIIAHSLRRYC